MSAIDVPSPMGGWNARDSLAAMPATDAVKMLNIIPRAGYVETRKGYVLHADGLGGPCDTLVTYRGGGAEKMVAGANGSLWNVSSDPPVSIKAGFANNQWQTTMHGTNMVLTNGVSTPQIYNGTTAVDIAVTGVTASTLWGCNSYKGRVFYWQRNAQSFWYPSAGAFQGALTQFSFAGLCNTGGSLIQVITWTIDSGFGLDDQAVFIFSTGEVLVYSGSDPGTAADWQLTGRFQIGEPLGIRAHAKVGATEIILTRDGYVDIAAALKEGRYSEKSAYSEKIIRAAKQAANDFWTQFGWEAILYPAGQLFIVNVPQTDVQQTQHVRSTSSGGWCEFSGWNARTFTVFNNLLYFGDYAGNVYLADIGAQDLSMPISWDAIQAFNPLGSRARKKQVTAVNVVSNFAFPAYFSIDILSDYSNTRSSTVTPAPYIPGAGWDTADWDVTDWDIGASELQATREGFRNARGFGYTLALSLRASTRSQNIIWYSTTFVFRPAGVI
jgi:hypothetical protein